MVRLAKFQARAKSIRRIRAVGSNQLPFAVPRLQRFHFILRFRCRVIRPTKRRRTRNSVVIRDLQIRRSRQRVARDKFEGNPLADGGCVHRANLIMVRLAKFQTHTKSIRRIRVVGANQLPLAARRLQRPHFVLRFRRRVIRPAKRRRTRNMVVI